MMIEVKGTKTQEPQQDFAQRYVLKNTEQRSKTPAILGAFVTGLALYLKSIFPVNAEAAVQGQSVDEEKSGHPHPTVAAVPTADRPPLDELPTGTVAAPKGTSGGGGRIVELLPPAEFIAIESPVIQDFRPSGSIAWKGFQPVNLLQMPANDNSGTTAQGVPGNSNDVADTGDGGGAAEDEDPEPLDVVPADPDSEAPADHEGNTPDEEPGGEPSEEEDPQSSNRAPWISGPVYLMDLSGCAILMIGLSDLLRHAIDPDGDALSVQNLSVSSGTLIQAGGGWIFQASPQLLGPVTISYEITDGELAVLQTAHFSVVRPLVAGTGGDDTLPGTMCGDDIGAGFGDDNIDGRAGNDVIGGGDGNDHIVGGLGDDLVFGGAGHDMIFGGAGNDQISGGAGSDRLFGGDGQDSIFGDDGDDTLSGGDGNDILYGGWGADTLEGDAGNDTILGEDGGDILSGGDGDDLLFAGAGNDTIKGDAGNDTIDDGAGRDVVRAGAGNDTVVASLDGDNDLYGGETGSDTLDYSATREGVTIDLVEGTACGIEIGDDIISGFETVKGGSGDDHFIAGAQPAILVGRDGENIFEFPPLPPPIATDAPVVVMHEIVDFKVGDLIRMSKYDLFEKVVDEMEDRFEDVYGDDFDEDNIPIRYGHEMVDGMKRTLIEADFNNDDVYETTVSLHGHQLLVIIENA